MPKRFLLVLIILLQTVFCLEVPKLTGRINDQANLLSTEQRQQLDDFLMSYERQTSNQLAVLIIPSLAGDSLEDFSIRVVEKWQLGQKGKNNGLLLLIALQERKIRFEVGYGLEPKITDAFSGELIREVLAPAFRENRFYDGIYSALYAITQKIGAEFQPDNFQKPVYRVDQSGVNNIPEGNLEVILILAIMFGFMAKSIGTVNYRRGFWGSIFLPIVVFMFLGIPFSLPLLLMLIIFGFPFTFIMILISTIFGMMGRGGFYGGGFGGGSSGGFGGFSGGGGSFGGGGSSGGW